MSIDYAAQFKTVSASTVDEMNRTWKRHRMYSDAKTAFRSAQRTENRGIDVAFAQQGNYFHVWAEQVGEEEIGSMVAVQCVACSRLITDRAVMQHMWDVASQCPSCGDGALLWDDGSLGLVADARVAATQVLIAYDALVAEHAALVRDGARDKRIDEAQGAIDEMTYDLAAALRGMLTE